VTRLVLIDAPVPGIGPWEEILKNPLLWHFRFGGPDMERLVAGRERIYLDRFWNEFSANPAKLHRSRPGPLRRALRPAGRHARRLRAVRRLRPGRCRQQGILLAQYGKLTMPVLALGGEKSFGPMMATVMRAAATNVTEGVVPASGHWIMEENPKATIALVRPFLDKPLATAL
jgi:pimeloyl-ACP methyl ester carboxylesterase